ncbi:MAG: hypothetical protein WC375_00125 [Methanomassiliicoccales archaeon]|jgi:hypothetical protein
MSLKRKVSYCWQSPFKNNDGEEIELELSFKTDNDGDPIFQKKISNDILVVGYLVQDEYCENPMESCDGMGHFYYASPHANNEEHYKFQEALGLREPEEDELDEFHLEAVQIVEAAWRKQNPDLDIDDPETRKTLQSIYFSENTSTKAFNGVSGTTWKDVVRGVEECLWRQSISDPHAIPIDIYTHGGSTICKIANFQEDCDSYYTQYTLPSYSAVWVPDKDARESLIIKAAEKCGIKVKVIQPLCCASEEKDRKPWIIGVGNERFSSWESAGNYARKLAETKKGNGTFRIAERKIAREFAESTINEFNHWANGDCYGIVVEWFDAEGIQIDNDSCWGFIGYEYAKKELQDSFEGNLVHLEKGLTEQKIVDSCKTFVNPKAEKECTILQEG